MYINPFVAGILATLLVEVCFVIIHGIIHDHEVETEIQEIELTEQEKEEIVGLLKSWAVKHNEQNNDN